MILRTRTANSLPSGLDAHTLFNFPISALIFPFPSGLHIQLSDQSSLRCAVDTFFFFFCSVNLPECSGTGIISNIYSSFHLCLYLYLSVIYLICISLSIGWVCSNRCIGPRGIDLELDWNKIPRKGVVFFLSYGLHSLPWVPLTGK